MNIQESGEMYLESIYVLSKKGENVRSIDVCEYLGYSKPSVSRAVNLLKSGGYLTMESDGRLALTEPGLEIAEKIYKRHTVLTNLFLKLGVSEKTALDDACKIEHHISDETFEAIQKYIKTI